MSQHISPTRELARFVTNLGFDDLPPEVVNKAILLILDCFGAGILSSLHTPCRIMVDVIRSLGGIGESAVWGRDFKTSSVNAALVNGTSAHGFELEDMHLSSGGIHPGTAVIPAAVATAERVGSINGKDLITAIVVGCETTIRVGKAVNFGKTAFGQFLRGFHAAPQCGVFGSAAAAGKILQLDEERMLHCIAIGGNQSSGLSSARSAAYDKRSCLGKAAQAGVMAALLAEKRFTGIINILEGAEHKGEKGFCRTTSESYDLKWVLEDLYDKFEFLDIRFKAHPTCSFIQSAVDATKEIMEETQIDPETIKEVIVGTSKVSRESAGYDYEPQLVNVAHAQLGYKYVLAALLCEGNLFVDQFTEEKLRDPNICHLARKIRVTVDPEIEREWPNRYANRVDVVLKDGARYSSLKKDMRSLGKEEIHSKFRMCATQVFSDRRVEDIIDTVEHLKRLDEVTLLTNLLIKDK